MEFAEIAHAFAPWFGLATDCRPSDPAPRSGTRLALNHPNSINKRLAMSANILSFGRIRSLAAAMAVVIVGSTAASAADKVTFLTSWFAQAEHGGFYQAKATGLYEKAGLDVTLKMGGPQGNGIQPLPAGAARVTDCY